MHRAKLQQEHGASGAIPLYAIAENARRAKLGKSLDEYRGDIGELFAPFSKVAAANPHAAAPVERSAEELATVTERNRIVAEPYTRMTVARDQVNQAAAIIICSVGKARELGVPEDKWVHIHAVTQATELELSVRPDLSKNPASIASVEAALDRAGKSMQRFVNSAEYRRSFGDGTGSWGVHYLIQGNTMRWKASANPNGWYTQRSGISVNYARALVGYYQTYNNRR